MSALAEARLAKVAAFEALQGWTEVSGIGLAPLADGSWVVKVNLRVTTSRPLPTEFLGVPVVSDVVGDIHSAEYFAGANTSQYTLDAAPMPWCPRHFRYGCCR